MPGRPARRRERLHRPALRRAASAGAALAFAWWAAGLPPFSASATVLVLAAGMAAMAWGARSFRRASPPLDRRAAVPWLAVAAAAAAWQLAAYLQHPRDDHPTVSSLTNALLDSQAARAAALVAWLAGAAALSRR